MNTETFRAELKAVWAKHHQPYHPTLTLDRAMHIPQLAKVLKAHACANIRHDMPARNVAEAAA